MLLAKDYNPLLIKKLREWVRKKFGDKSINVHKRDKTKMFQL